MPSTSIKTRGFSLVELMVVIVIIGILAVIAMPAYKKYVLKSKMAESYTIIDNYGKINMSAYADNKEFVPFDNNQGGLSTNMPVLDLPNSPYALFGYPIAVGTNLNFVYHGLAGKFNAAGAAATNTLFFYPPANTLPIPFQSLSTLVGARYTSNGARCNATLNGSGLGLTAQANYDWAIIAASADFKGDEGACTMVIRIMEASGNNPGYRTGFIVVNYGE